MIWPNRSNCLKCHMTRRGSVSTSDKGNFALNFILNKPSTRPKIIMTKGRPQKRASLDFICSITSCLVIAWVRLITLINKTGINPAQTDNSKTAAKGAFILKIIRVNMALVKAKPIAERKRLLHITVQSAALTNNIKIRISRNKLTSYNRNKA